MRSSVIVTVGIVGVAVAACGDNIPPDSDDILSQFSVRSVGTLPAQNDRGIALTAVDDKTVAIARATVAGAQFCPGCRDNDPSCAAVCTRTRISVRVLRVGEPANDGEMPGKSTTIIQVFPKTPSHAVNSVDIVTLAGNRVGVAWLECDNSSCLGTQQKQTCDARYTTLDLDPQRVGDIQLLYTQRYGDLQIVADAANSRILALTTKQQAVGVGLRAAIFDETGAAELEPWMPLGGMSTRAATATATRDGFAIVGDDRNPARPTPAEPCRQACDCLAGGGADELIGGLYAFYLGSGPPRSERIASGVGDDGSFAMREVIAVTEANQRLVVAAGQSIEGSAELFAASGGVWDRRLVSQAPLPSWIGVLGDARRLAWLGSERATRTTEALVAGVIDGQITAHGTIAMASPSQVFDVAPVVMPNGVTRAFLLRGVRNDSQGVEAFEVVEIRTRW